MTDYNRQNMGTSTSASTGTSTSGMTGMTGTMGGTRRWEDFQDTYRSDWQNRFGKDSNRSWDEHQRGFRYGWESAQQDRFRGREFNQAESDLRSGWNDWNTGGHDYTMGEHKGHSVNDHKSFGGKVEHIWDNFKDTVREGWDRARMEFRDDHR